MRVTWEWVACNEGLRDIQLWQPPQRPYFILHHSIFHHSLVLRLGKYLGKHVHANFMCCSRSCMITLVHQKLPMLYSQWSQKQPLCKDRRQCKESVGRHCPDCGESTRRQHMPITCFRYESAITKMFFKIRIFYSYLSQILINQNLLLKFMFFIALQAHLSGRVSCEPMPSPFRLPCRCPFGHVFR